MCEITSHRGFDRRYPGLKVLYVYMTGMLFPFNLDAGVAQSLTGGLLTRVTIPSCSLAV